MRGGSAVQAEGSFIRSMQPSPIHTAWWLLLERREGRPAVSAVPVQGRPAAQAHARAPWRSTCRSSVYNIYKHLSQKRA